MQPEINPEERKTTMKIYVTAALLSVAYLVLIDALGLLIQASDVANLF
jgi:hypothetical protein